MKSNLPHILDINVVVSGVMPADGSMEWNEEAKQFFTAAVSEKMVWVRLVAQDSTSQILWMQ